MSKPDSFHSYRDGRGFGRRVFVNGNEVKRVRWCDTKAGVVVYIPWPARIKKPEGDVVYTRRLRGTVTVQNVE